MKILYISLILILSATYNHASQMQRPPTHIQKKLEAFSTSLNELKSAAQKDAQLRPFVENLEKTTRIIEQKSQQARRAGGMGQMTNDIKQAIEAQQDAVENLIDNAKKSSNSAIKQATDRLTKIQDDLMDEMQKAQPQQAVKSSQQPQRKMARRVQ